MQFMLLKELRENAKWIVVGLVIMLALTAAALPKSISDYTNSLKPYLGFAGALFAILLGVVQSTWDFSNRQQGFLLHRALSRNQVLIAKMLAGFIIYAIVTGIPLLIAAGYFSVMGPDYLPVRPLQIVAPTLLVALCYFLHPITISMQLRPAKWLGTKALPLISPVILCYFFYAVHDNRWESWAMFMLLGLILGAMSFAVFSLAAQKIAVVANSVAGLTLAVSFVGFYLLTNAESSSPEDSVIERGIDDVGTVWEFRSRYKYDPAQRYSKREILSGSPVILGQQVNLDAKIPADLKLNSLAPMSPVHEATKNYGQISRSAGVGDITVFWDERGYFLVYEVSKSHRLLGTTTRDGFSPGNDPKGRRFSANPFSCSTVFQHVGMSEQYTNGLYTSCLIADQNGVYLMDQSTGDLQIVLDKQVKAVAPLMRDQRFSDDFVVETDDALEHFKMNRTDSQVGTELGPKDLLAKEVSFTKFKDYPKLPDDSERYWWIGLAANGKLGALQIALSGQQEIATLSPSQQNQWLIQPVDIVPQLTQAERYMPLFARVLGAVPAVLVAILTLSLVTNLAFRDESSAITYLLSSHFGKMLVANYLAAIVLTTLIAIVAMYFVARNRTTDMKSILWWMGLTIPLGLAAPLAMVAIYPRLVFEGCSKCQRLRRVDRVKCEHCGSGWESLPVQGIEIIESQQFDSISTAH